MRRALASFTSQVVNLAPLLNPITIHMSHDASPDPSSPDVYVIDCVDKTAMCDKPPDRMIRYEYANNSEAKEKEKEKGITTE